MNTASTESSSEEKLEFSLVRGGPFWSVRQKLVLTPEKGFGLAQRIAALIVITWAPTMLGAVIEGRAFEGTSPDPLVRHFGVHARLLITLPLFILAEGVWDRVFALIIRQFVATGLIDTASLPVAPGAICCWTTSPPRSRRRDRIPADIPAVRRPEP